MPRNDKSFRLRALRDRLHITGEHAPTFTQAVAINLEILSIIKSPRNLALVRRDVQKLRDRLTEPTTEQIEKIAFLDQRLAQKIEQARIRKEKKHSKRPPKPQPVAPQPSADVW